MSLDYPANKEAKDSFRAIAALLNRRDGIVVPTVDARRPALPPTSDEEHGAERIIDEEFSRRLAGLRRLPRRDRIHALRAARHWRELALLALRDRRAEARYARWLARRLPPPSPPQ